MVSIGGAPALSASCSTSAIALTRASASSSRLVRRKSLASTAWHAASGAVSLLDANAQDLRVGQQPVEVGPSGARGIGAGAVEGSPGGVPEDELGPDRKIGEVDQEVCALGGREHEALARGRHGGLE